MLESFEEKWQKWALTKKLILSGFCFGMLALLGIMCVVKPCFLKVGKIRHQVYQLQADLLSQSQLGIQDNHGTGPSVMLEQLIELCHRHNVLVRSLRVSPSLQQKYYQIAPINISLAGAYASILQCLQNLERQHVMMIKDFNIRPQGRHKVLMQLKLLIFLLPSALHFSSKPCPDYSQSISPFQNNLASKKLAHPLTAYPLSEFKLLGTLQINQKFYAIVMSPMGRACQITVGTSIGVEQAKVTAIRPFVVLLKQLDGSMLGLKLARG
ncbi:MAG: Pilus assembly protein PilP [Gammaproteobacteria bacterium]|jgi:hypothetical protein|nr:Pilus assembly protein PilP [Gammaproteobacteria bacterium]